MILWVHLFWILTAKNCKSIRENWASKVLNFQRLNLSLNTCSHTHSCFINCCFYQQLVFNMTISLGAFLRALLLLLVFNMTILIGKFLRKFLLLWFLLVLITTLNQCPYQIQKPEGGILYILL